jgi:preprotein translocase SecF subunit
VFHLTRYKYWFFGISLAVIVPGLLALIIWHLNLGIDFTGGSLIELRFANGNVSTTAVGDAFANPPKNVKPAKDVNVYLVSDVSSGQKAAQYVYITFDKPIGKNVEQAVLDDLRKVDDSLTQDQTYYKYDVGQNPTGLMVVHFASPVKADAINAALKNLPASDPPPAVTSSGQTQATPAASATPTPSANGSQTYPVSAKPVQLGANSNTYQVDTQTPLEVGDLNKIVFSLAGKYGPAYVQSKTTASAAIGAETTRNAALAVAVAAIAILLYIAFAFRKVGTVAQAFRFGASAIIALLHDVLVVLGLWAIFGKLFDFKVDSLFLTAVLTVIGFSVHDTIVVFDRIRENMRRRTSESFEQITNASLVQTMSRSLNTSLTVLLTLAALTLFGGASIREFTLALLIGIMSGTYSSIFNASMLLVVWETGEWRRWFRLKPKAVAATGRRELAGSRA